MQKEGRDPKANHWAGRGCRSLLIWWLIYEETLRCQVVLAFVDLGQPVREGVAGSIGEQIPVWNRGKMHLSALGKVFVLRLSITGRTALLSIIRVVQGGRGSYGGTCLAEPLSRVQDSRACEETGR